MRSLLLLPLFLVTLADAPATTYRLYYLGGQSNMDGYGKVSELPPALRGEMKDVMIFHGNPARDTVLGGGIGLWARLRPGHGAGFSSTGDTNSYSENFGLELTFAKRLAEIAPDQRIAIIKYSRGGTGIDTAAAGEWGCWEPDFRRVNGINQWDNFLTTVRGAMSVADIDRDGVKDTLVPSGIVWMQGESDGVYTEEIARRYQSNLKRLVDLIRAAFRVDHMPVVIGRITDSGRYTGKTIWPYGGIVRAAQEAYVAGDFCAALVTTTEEYKYSDAWHYDSGAYIHFGAACADALAGLKARCGP
jgi:hypothetical protein